MTPEERFIRIENALARIAKYQERYEGYQARHEEYLKEQEARQRVHDANLSRIEANLERFEGNLERLEIATETSSHELNLKIRKLTEFQSTLMESQTSAWRTVDQLGAKIDRVTDNLDRLIRFRSGNGDSN